MSEKKTSDKKRDVAVIRAFAMWAAATCGVIAFLIVGSASAKVMYDRMYQGQIFPGVRILGVRVDGMTPDEAHEVIQKAIDQALEKGLPFTFQEKNIRVDVTAVGDPDTAHDLVRYDIDHAVQAAFAVGRSSGWRKDALEQVSARVYPVRISVETFIDEKGIEDAIADLLHNELAPAQNARLDIRAVTGTEPLIRIEPERSGVSVKMESAFDVLRRQSASLSFEPITLHMERTTPRVTAEMLRPLTEEVRGWLSRPQLTFVYEDKNYPISTSTLITWIGAIEEGGTMKPALDPDSFRASLKQLIPSLEQESKKGSLVVIDGKIQSFVPGAQGRTLNVEKTLAAVMSDWPQHATFPLVMDTVAGALIGDDPDRLGIKEIIGIGKSNFSGSPVNRRKNIAKGIQQVNGSIIAPGEEFSLIKTLGAIDGEHGWFPELVIKGDKTLPEFGGGLCQIGTTVFRGALDSGLKITQRQNHAYRVSYYEPAGTDATIYDPQPDMRFVNDTHHHVLVNAYNKGDDIFFEFWGTKDGRTVDPSWHKPKISNITSPPPTKLIETTELAPGKKKCTETAHNGADAEFMYTVTYADGSKSEKLFKSHYRPWQAVCLIGVAPGTSTSTASGTEVAPGL